MVSKRISVQKVSLWAEGGSSDSLPEFDFDGSFWTWSDGKWFVCVRLKCSALNNQIISSWVHQSRHQTASCRVN